jgi:hypothetical protein
MTAPLAKVINTDLYSEALRQGTRNNGDQKTVDGPSQKDCGRPFLIATSTGVMAGESRGASHPELNQSHVISMRVPIIDVPPSI